MMRNVYLLFMFLFLCTEVPGQGVQDTVPSGKLDTIVLYSYNKHGKLDGTTTWIGTNFHFSEDYYILGEPPTYYDTLEAFDFGTVYIREFDEDGKLKEETKQERGEDVFTRYYYYTDSVFGYTQFNSLDKIVNTKSYTYEFWPDSTPRIIGYSEKLKREGRYQTFYSNGNRQCDCFYRNGERDSLQTMYHENGQMQWKLLYKDGKPWEVFINLDVRGSELEKGTLKDGNGTLLIYDDDGKLLYTNYYKRGKLKDTVEAQ